MIADQPYQKLGEAVEKADMCKADTSRTACGAAKSKTDIRDHMEVVASCGMHVGVVDHVEGKSVKLTKQDSAAGGKHHFIPLDWVAKVDEHVHLNRNHEEVFREWKAEPVGAGA